MTTYGLPKPDHKLFEAHPTVSSELLPRLGHGDITVKPNIDRFAGGRTVRFVDGSEEEIDLVVYCTGYKITFPFFDPKVFSAPENRLPLYRRVVSVERPGLYFIGFIQPLGPIMPLAEAQCEWIADLLGGRATLPPAGEMKREIAREEQKMRRSASLPLSAIPSRSISILICARSSASESGLPSRLDHSGPSARGAGRRWDGRAAPMGTAAPRTAGSPRSRTSLEAAAVFVGYRLGLVVLLGRPVDKPHRCQDRNLEHHGKEEDRPEPRHLSQCREVAQALRASTCPSSRPRWGSVGTSRVGTARRSAHS